jgi:hypothetical protein
MPTRRAHTLSVSIERDPALVYRFIRDPRNLTQWAPGFALSARREETGWRVETAGGSVGIEFAPENPFGVVDHTVTADGVPEVIVPMRVVGNRDGAEVVFTLFEPDGMTPDELQRDLGLVDGDLHTLKRLMEAEPS